jgi:hypothetical protein
MASSRSIEYESTAAAEATLARPLAPEDIRVGDFIAPLFEIVEIASYCWYGESWNLPLNEPVRVRYIPTCDPLPLRVKSVCLPFLLATTPAGEPSTIDVRKYQLARLGESHAKRAWKAYRKAKEQSKANPTA